MESQRSLYFFTLGKTKILTKVSRKMEQSM